MNKFNEYNAVVMKPAKNTESNLHLHQELTEKTTWMVEWVSAVFAFTSPAAPIEDALLLLFYRIQ